MIIGIYLVSNPGSAVALSNGVGLASSQVVVDRNLLVSVEPSNRSYASVHLENGDELSGSISANPPGVDFLLMNAGNFSEWVSARGGSYEIYPQSSLGVSEYSFTFTNSMPAGDYYLGFVSHSQSGVVDVLIHLTIARQLPYNSFLLSVLFVLVGVVVLAFAFRGGKRHG